MAAVHIKQPLVLRPVILGLILLAELLTVSLGYDAYQPALFNSGQWFDFLSYSGQFAKIVVAVLVFATLGLLPRIPLHFAALNQSINRYPYQYSVVAQFVSFALLLWCTSLIFGQGASANDLSSLLVLAWLAALTATVAFWLLALAPVSYWRKLIGSESVVFITALLVGVLTWVLASFAQTLWTPLSDLTFQFSATLLNLIYPEIVVDPELKRLGVRDFVVSIAPVCSGYEGMGLMAVFTGFYLSVFRNDFRFPQALLLFPIGIVTIWLFNNLRIAALISIGASFSPAVAIGGFHSQAGWISFIIVIVTMLLVAYRLPYFSNVAQAQRGASVGLTLPMALLIPFIVLLGSTILTSAVSAGFDWLYPLRVVACALALGVCWRHYGLTWPTFKLEPQIAGAVVFVLWVALVPTDETRNETFAAQLFSESPAIIITWLMFRVIGSVVTVPLAEELLFRGYLLARIARQPFALEGRIAFSWVALVASSVLFGLLHANWIAGIAAGLIFGWVRYRADSIKDAVIAHASANLLLTVYILMTGNWSLW